MLKIRYFVSLVKGLYFNFSFSKYGINQQSFKNTFTISKKNKNLLILCSYVFITLVYCPYLDNHLNDQIDNNPLFFLYMTLFGFFFNIWNSRRTNTWKFISFPNLLPKVNFSNFNIFFKIFKNNLSKFLIFLKNSVFQKLIFSLTKLFGYVCSKFVFWKPIFKKSSYFSFYKSIISKFKKK